MSVTEFAELTLEKLENQLMYLLGYKSKNTEITDLFNGTWPGAVYLAKGFGE